ncbi:MAG: TolB family protein [Spirochaetota bacterium]
MRFTITALLIIIVLILLPVTALFGAELYDLGSWWTAMNQGRLLFARLRNPTMDPVLKTYEIYLFDPATGVITFLQKPGEKLPLLPAAAPDGTALTYYAIIEGNDYLVTRNLDEGRSTRLRFDTGGYIEAVALDFDRDRLLTVNKRGENRQALYLISNRRGTIRRILNGARFQEIGFLANGGVQYTDLRDGRRVLGVVRPRGLEQTVLSGMVHHSRASPRGDAVLFREFDRVSMYRVNTGETVRLSDQVSADPMISPEGTTCAVFEPDALLLVNLPTGDVMYYLAAPSDPRNSLLNDFSFYTVREKSIHRIMHRDPGQQLTELYRGKGALRLLAVSRDDRFVYFQEGSGEDGEGGPPGNRVTVFDRTAGKTVVKSFPFTVEELLAPRVRVSDGSFYIRALAEVPGERVPARELYYYHLPIGALIGVSTARDAELRLYYRK